MKIEFKKTDDSPVMIESTHIIAMSEQRGTTMVHISGFNFHVQGTYAENVAKWQGADVGEKKTTQVK